MSEAVQLELVRIGIPAIFSLLTLVVMWFLNSRSKKIEGGVGELKEKVDHNITLSNSMLSRTVAKKEAAEQKLETTHAETVAELKAKLAEKEATIALMAKVPGGEVKEPGEVRQFKPEIKEGGLDR